MGSNVATKKKQYQIVTHSLRGETEKQAMGVSHPWPIKNE